MKTELLITELIKKSNWNGDDGLNKETLNDFLVDILSEYYDIYYDNLLPISMLSYWNEERTIYRPRFEFPNEFIEFLFRSQRETISLGGAFGMTLFGWPTMLYRTMNRMSDGQVDNMTEPHYWVEMASRGDKGYIYLCCDTTHVLFGKVVEFEDGSPWILTSPELGDSTVYGNFEEFMQYTIKNF